MRHTQILSMQETAGPKTGPIAVRADGGPGRSLFSGRIDSGDRKARPPRFWTRGGPSRHRSAAPL